jgi:hypothetical protein
MPNLNDHFMINGYSTELATDTEDDVTLFEFENQPTYDQPFHVPILADPNKFVNPAQQFDFIHRVIQLLTELDVYFPTTSNS